MGSFQKKHNATIIEGKDYGISPSSKYRVMTTMSPKTGFVGSYGHGNIVVTKPYMLIQQRPESSKLERELGVTSPAANNMSPNRIKKALQRTQQQRQPAVTPTSLNQSFERENNNSSNLT